MKDRGMFELPPKGARGELVGTSWDPNKMVDDFGVTESFNEGAV